MSEQFTISSSPHISSPLSTQKTMALVIASLIPAGAAGVYFFGARSLAVIAVCTATCVLSEYVWQKLTRQRLTISDLSAVVTGLLLACNLPPTIPIWMAAVGAVFAIIVVKQFFGGIGGNIVNPALAARAMMLISWPVAMTTWTIDGTTSATPLALMKAGDVTAANLSLSDMLIGRMPGCIGETASALLLLGGVFLIWQKVISWRIPVVYIVTTVAACSVMKHGGAAMPLHELLSGGLLLGAIFMATDYVTSPITPRGQIIFALGCGVLTALIRTFGGYPEGVSYSILIMNTAVPLIDAVTRPRILGEAKRG